MGHRLDQELRCSLCYDADSSLECVASASSGRAIDVLIIAKHLEGSGFDSMEGLFWYSLGGI